jgi:hypothetical protein
MNIDLFNESTIDTAWYELNKIGFIGKDAGQWRSRRYIEEDFLPNFRNITTPDNVLVVRAEGSKLQFFQNDLEKLGVVPDTPNSIDNIYLQFILVYPAGMNI